MAYSLLDNLLLPSSNSDNFLNDVSDDILSWRRSSRTKKTHNIEDGMIILGIDVGQIHLAECVLKVDLSRRPPFTVMHWEVINLGSGTVSKSVKQLCLVARLKPFWKSADFVIIEQQKRKNTKMVAMSHAIEAVMLMLNKERVCLFASSVAKFNIFRKMTSLGPSTSLIHEEPKDGTPYQKKKVRKCNAIRIIDALLGETKESEIFQLLFQNTPSNQMDDLADAMVYAVAFIYKNEPSKKCLQHDIDKSALIND
jgi:hypothetical protein